MEPMTRRLSITQHNRKVHTMNTHEAAARLVHSLLSTLDDETEQGHPISAGLIYTALRCTLTQYYQLTGTLAAAGLIVTTPETVTALWPAN